MAYITSNKLFRVVSIISTTLNIAHLGGIRLSKEIFNTYELKKKYLNGYYWAMENARRIEEQIKRINDRLYGIKSANITGMPRGGVCKGKDEMLDDKNKKIKLLKKRLHRAEKKRDEIERYIETLDDPKEIMILQLVYVDGLTLSQAANEMKYSESTAKRIHKSAITNLEDKVILYGDEN